MKKENLPPKRDRKAITKAIEANNQSKKKKNALVDNLYEDSSFLSLKCLCFGM